MKIEDLKGVELNFSRVKKTRDRRIEEFAKWKTGELEASREFEEWLLGAITLGRVRYVGPGMGRKLWNFAKAVLKHLFDRRKLAKPATRRSRLETCGECELFDAQRTSCLHSDCGCPLRQKVRWASESCPIGKWSVE